MANDRDGVDLLLEPLRHLLDETLYVDGGGKFPVDECHLVGVRRPSLAKNAGTSVEQIERFYAKHLPLSREMAKEPAEFWGGVEVRLFLAQTRLGSSTQIDHNLDCWRPSLRDVHARWTSSALNYPAYIEADVEAQKRVVELV